jgi:hypothetical protein
MTTNKPCFPGSPPEAAAQCVVNRVANQQRDSRSALQLCELNSRKTLLELSKPTTRKVKKKASVAKDQKQQPAALKDQKQQVAITRASSDQEEEAGTPQMSCNDAISRMSKRVPYLFENGSTATPQERKDNANILSDVETICNINRSSQLWAQFRGKWERAQNANTTDFAKKRAVDDLRYSIVQFFQINPNVGGFNRQKHHLSTSRFCPRIRK